MNLSRRSFLKGLGAICASPLLPSISLASESNVSLQQSFPRYIASLTGNPENVADVHLQFRKSKTGILEYKIFTREGQSEVVELRKDFDLRFLEAMIERDTGLTFDDMSKISNDYMAAGDFRMASWPTMPAGSFDAVFRIVPKRKPSAGSFT